MNCKLDTKLEAGGGGCSPQNMMAANVCSVQFRYISVLVLVFLLTIMLQQSGNFSHHFPAAPTDQDVGRVEESDYSYHFKSHQQEKLEVSIWGRDQSKTTKLL